MWQKVLKVVELRRKSTSVGLIVGSCLRSVMITVNWFVLVKTVLPLYKSWFYHFPQFKIVLQWKLWILCQVVLIMVKRINEPRHDKTNKMSVRPARTQISLGICPVWSEPSLCAQWVAKDPSFLHADSEDSDQTGRMPRLIWVFAGCTLILLVLSCHGPNNRKQDILVINWYYTYGKQNFLC